MLASGFVFPTPTINAVAFDLLWSNPDVSIDFSGGTYNIPDTTDYKFFFVISGHPQEGYVVNPIIKGNNYIYTPAGVESSGNIWFITRLVNMQTTIVQFGTATGKAVTSDAAGFQVVNTFKPFYLYGVK